MYPLYSKRALQSYSRVQSSAMSPKQAEVMAFNRAASLLKKASENIANYPSYAAALQFNLRLWTAVQAELVENRDRVPDPIRTQILDLSLFVDKQTMAALGQPNAESLNALIEIDMSMAEGLSLSG